MLLICCHKHLQLMKPVAGGKMFTFRFSLYQITQYLLIYFALSGVIAKQTAFQCAPAGEYCLNHWDCCSNACLSYLYRCARGRGVYPYPFLDISYKPTVTLDQILEQNFFNPNAKPYFSSRLGNDDNIAGVTETKVLVQEAKVESPTSVTLVDLQHLNHVAASTSNSSIELEETPTSTAHYLHEEKSETQTDSESPATQETAAETSDKSSCAKIGEKCYQHEDCCDKLCHGYLHQCVT